MAYTDQTTPYAGVRTEAHARHDTAYAHGGHWGAGATIFTWVAWALAASFWAATFTTALGIFESITHPTQQVGGSGGVDAGGVGWAMIDVVGGVIVLGLALAYGLFRYATRDKRMDPVTEASTAALYNGIERGGDDESSLSPEAHTATERDAYRNMDRPSA